MEVALFSPAPSSLYLIPKTSSASPKSSPKNVVSFAGMLRFLDSTSNVKFYLTSFSSCSSFSTRTSAMPLFGSIIPISHALSFRVGAGASASAAGVGQRHWTVLTEPPTQVPTSKPEMIDYFVKILRKVLGSEKDAQMCMYDVSCVTHFGFCCDIDEEMAINLARVDGVLLVKPDLDYNSIEKNFSLPKVQSRPPADTHPASPLLFPMESTEHWLVRMDKPPIEVITKGNVVDYFVQTLTKVVGNEKDAQMCMYHVDWQTYFGFCCELGEDCAKELAGTPGVLAVCKDENFEFDNKDYEGLLSFSTEHKKVNASSNINTKKLFVTGLSFYTSEKTLRAAFEDFGELVEVKVIMDKISKRSKGYAFLKYTSEDAARTALKEMNGKIINGWMIVVDYARSTPKYNNSRGRHRPAV